ncbi:MAG: arylsulfatase [Woeseiaceae bacterium]|nr:arylsulfatase [Woeseiaceae bacterium]
MFSSRTFARLAAGCIVLAVALPGPVSADSVEAGLRDPRPNILLIVADDLGYADLGVYGSDIDTPNIDALAARGMLFTQFHTAPMCAPTRAMLLSGNNNHVAGMAGQQRQGIRGVPYPGYEDGLSDRIAPLPRLLRDAGYHTYTAGKWHLGTDAARSPAAAGFTRSFSLMEGAGNHWDSIGFENGPTTWWADDDFGEYPAGRYSTEVYTDRLIEFIEADRETGKPFFAFAAYTSPHWPLQVPDEYLDLYAGHYDDGYDSLRERRFESLQAAGIVPADSALPPRNPSIVPWQSLDTEEQRRESRKMELYAAMVDNLDDHVGRLVDYLRDSGLCDNTLIVFMADNGAAGEDFYNRGPFIDYVRDHYDNAYEKMGTRASFVSYDYEWAEAGSAPYSRSKTYTREGGIVAPMIVAGPGVTGSDVIEHGYVTVMDLAPTFLAIAGARYPDDGSVMPMLGESMTGLLAGTSDRVHDDDYVTTLYHRGRAFLRQGPWKIVTLDPPFDESAFELFDIVEDPGETNDLAATHPEKYEELIELWRAERRRLGIVLPQDL